MQDIAPVIVFVGVLVFLAHLFTTIFSRTKVPDVLLLIIIGIFVGPILGLVSPEQFGAAAVLASIPLQQGVTGGELIRSVTYGVVLLSIVITSFLLLLLEKTKLSDGYGWIFSPHKLALSDFYSWVSLLPKSKLLSRTKTLPSETKLYVKTWLSNFGKSKK